MVVLQASGCKQQSKAICIMLIPNCVYDMRDRIPILIDLNVIGVTALSAVLTRLRCDGYARADLTTLLWDTAKEG
jgi:hypothetical protein